MREQGQKVFQRLVRQGRFGSDHRALGGKFTETPENLRTLILRTQLV